MWPGSAPFAGIIMRFTWNHWVGKAAMHKARITPARSSSHTLYMHIYTLTQPHTLAAQSEPYTICVLRFIMQISCRSRSTFSPQQSLLLLLLLFFTGRLICYCCMACGLKKYFYLIYLWMKWRLLAVAVRVGLAIKAIASASASASASAPSRPCWNCWHFQLRVPTALSHR